ncbi:anthranilate phosphoribosyltransferase [Paenibacillus guangzhouensis]|uniref:anthranilate phosphoribosyltransferase n=1 Tax=Paenibacillus guangzhouensis TaxID=1473112 RepID=UPI001266B1ED|nr:anthranilate phosphoribosyltransferase [Paenibacillus guangzhouensis]
MSREDQVIIDAIDKLIGGHDLTREEAQEIMHEIMEGHATSAQIGSILTAMRIKGETVDEITGFAEVMRSKSNRVLTEQHQLLDTCGTGGSGIHKFNISTVSAIIASANGVRVAKHGNRTASGRVGSADVLEALGVNIHLTSNAAAQCLNDINICFMFAQVYHPSMKHAAGPRRELGVRTIFNMLGPLTNPAGADRQLLGIYDRSKTETIGGVLQQLGLKRAMVVSSHDGLDEISISAPTRVTELRQGDLRTFDIDPEQLGLRTHSLGDVLGGDAETNAMIIRNILQGERGAYRDIVLANAGACIYVSGQSSTIQEGVKLAGELIDSGRALAKLEQLIKTTGEMAYVS